MNCLIQVYWDEYSKELAEYKEKLAKYKETLDPVMKKELSRQVESIIISAL